MYEVSAPVNDGHGKPKHSLFVNLNKTEVTPDTLETIVKASEDARAGFPACSPEKIDRRGGVIMWWLCQLRGVKMSFGMIKTVGLYVDEKRS